MNVGDFESEAESEPEEEWECNFTFTYEEDDQRFSYSINEHNHNPAKRPKIETLEQHEDRISALPDSILLDIISLLPSVEDSIRTGSHSYGIERFAFSTVKEQMFESRTVYPKTWLPRASKSSPDLETLTMNWDPPFKSKLACGFHTRANYLTHQNKNFQCLQLHLKTIKIAYNIEWDRGCELVQFLLNNACVLEKIVVKAGGEDIKPPCCIAQELLDLTRKLLSFPRASRNAVVLLK